GNRCDSIRRKWNGLCFRLSVRWNKSRRCSPQSRSVEKNCTSWPEKGLKSSANRVRSPYTNWRSSKLTPICLTHTRNFAFFVPKELIYAHSVLTSVANSACRPQWKIWCVPAPETLRSRCATRLKTLTKKHVPVSFRISSYPLTDYLQ